MQSRVGLVTALPFLDRCGQQISGLMEVSAPIIHDCADNRKFFGLDDIEHSG